VDDRFDPAVRVADYDPAWPELAEEELRRVEHALGEVAVRLEHVGSTAVPGLAAKPVVCLQLSVVAIEPRQRYLEPLERLGYLFVPPPESPDYHFFAKPPERPRTYHLHVCASTATARSPEFRARSWTRAWCYRGEIPDRRYALTIDSGWRAVAQPAFTFAQRFCGGRRKRTFGNAHRGHLTNRAPDAHV
jgi:GrpB-like predicted nucleotidyltransferase (UPF0157 family)